MAVHQRRKGSAETNSDTPESNTSPSIQDDEEEEELRQLTEDLRTLDEQSETASRLLIYKRNRYVFLLQSMLLGIAYSIVWPTLLPYTRHNMRKVSMKIYGRLVYGITYAAYPIGSMLSAKIVEKSNFSTRNMILFLNCFEIIGNLLYTISIFPLFAVLGRFTAGLGDAFYVVLIREMHGYSGNSNEKITIECLAAFVLGVILSPGINVLTTFIPFNILKWEINTLTYPGFTAAVLFILMQFVVLIFLRRTDVDEDDDDDEEENTKQGSSSSEGNGERRVSTSRFVEIEGFIRELEYTSWFVNICSFIYTFIVATFELIIPFLLYDRLTSIQSTNNDLKSLETSAMLMYAIIGTVYAMFLMLTMTVTFKYQPEVFVGISVLSQIAGLFAITYFMWLSKYTVVADMVGIGVLVLALSALWSIDDVLFVNMIQMLVPHHLREATHDMRKISSKVAFGIAGLSVPVMFPSPLYIVCPVFIVLVCLIFVMFVAIKLAVTKKDSK